MSRVIASNQLVGVTGGGDGIGNGAAVGAGSGSGSGRGLGKVRTKNALYGIG